MCEFLEKSLKYWEYNLQVLENEVIRKIGHLPTPVE
jgi:hypothetical protein